MDVRPAPVSAQGRYVVSAEQTAIGWLSGHEPHTAVALRVTNVSPEPWRIEAGDVTLAIDGVDARVTSDGLDRSSRSIHSARPASDVVVPAGEARVVWARFPNVRPSKTIDGPEGARVERALQMTIAVETPDGLIELAAADPVTASPVWRERSSPGLALLRAGVGVTGWPELTRSAAMTYDMSMSLQLGLPENFDVGALGIVRFGIASWDGWGHLYTMAGGGPSAGWTVKLGSFLLRLSSGWIVARVAHDSLETTPHMLYAGVEFGATRSRDYPFVGSPGHLTLALHAQLFVGIGNFAEYVEPEHFTFSAGLTVRGGR